MIYDPDLIEKIQKLPRRSFSGNVFRATGRNADPTAFSSNGGRWAPADTANGGCLVLYTSTERNGALAEVASYLSLLTPVPTKALVVHTLDVAPQRTLTLALTDFNDLGISRSSYGERHYERTQTIGAAVNFLELDGLLAPSARWDCDNLMIFGSNYSPEAKLDVVASETVQFETWSQFAANRRPHEKG